MVLALHTMGTHMVWIPCNGSVEMRSLVGVLCRRIVSEVFRITLYIADRSECISVCTNASV